MSNTLHDQNSSNNSRKTKGASHTRFRACAIIATVVALLLAGPAHAIPITDWDPLKSKTATNLDDDFKSKVTLSLPAASTTQPMDLVFVVDGSTSTDQDELTDHAAELLDELAAMKNLDVKASVVVFGGSVPILGQTPLLSLSDPTNVNTLQATITDPSYKGMSGRSGSNLDAGVETGSAILSADTSVPPKDKYLVVLTDGAARTWHKDGEVYSKAFMPNHEVSSPSWNYSEDYNIRYQYPADPFTPRTFSQVWANGGGLGNPVDNYGMTKAAANAGNAASPETVRGSPDYYTTYEASTYHAAKSITEATNASTNVILVTYPYWPDTLFGKYLNSFKDWLGNRKNISRYDTGNGLSPKEIFATLEGKLTHTVDKGSRVLDVMGVTNDYDFDFVNDAAAMSIDVNGTTLEAKKIGTNRYGFGPDSSGNYRFTLVYYPNGTEGKTECYVWTINQPVTIDEDVALTYTVTLANPKTAPGTYGKYDRDGSQNFESLNVNNSAVLYPVDTDGKNGDPLTYGQPTVSYSVPGNPVSPSTESTNPDPGQVRSSEEPPSNDDGFLASTGARGLMWVLGIAIALLIVGGICLAASPRLRQRVLHRHE